MIMIKMRSKCEMQVRTFGKVWPVGFMQKLRVLVMMTQRIQPLTIGLSKIQ